MLSNFHECEIIGLIDNKKYKFKSSEHYYVAHFVEDIQDFIFFMVAFD